MLQLMMAAPYQLAFPHSVMQLTIRINRVDDIRREDTGLSAVNGATEENQRAAAENRCGRYDLAHCNGFAQEHDATERRKNRHGELDCCSMSGSQPAQRGIPDRISHAGRKRAG